MGCPILYGYDEAKDPECEENSKQWNDILDKMIETFKIAEKIANQDYIYFSTKDNSFQEWLKCYEQMKKIHEECSGRSYDVHIMDFGECQYYEEGFDLFRKYFFALWD